MEMKPIMNACTSEYIIFKGSIVSIILEFSELIIFYILIFFNMSWTYLVGGATPLNPPVDIKNWQKGV